MGIKVMEAEHEHASAAPNQAFVRTGTTSLRDDGMWVVAVDLAHFAESGEVRDDGVVAAWPLPRFEVGDVVRVGDSHSHLWAGCYVVEGVRSDTRFVVVDGYVVPSSLLEPAEECEFEAVSELRAGDVVKHRRMSDPCVVEHVDTDYAVARQAPGGRPWLIEKPPLWRVFR